MSLSRISRSVWALVDGHQALSEREQTKSSFAVERSCARTPDDTHLCSVGFPTADQDVTYFAVLSRPGNQTLLLGVGGLMLHHHITLSDWSLHTTLHQGPALS